MHMLAVVVAYALLVASWSFPRGHFLAGALSHSSTGSVCRSAVALEYTLSRHNFRTRCILHMTSLSLTWVNASHAR
eukprot:1855864-Amphidinium_carterae.1